ncbi:MAG: hypothetical protein ABI779_13350, partial [Acidobacteriota bacterium]
GRRTHMRVQCVGSVALGALKLPRRGMRKGIIEVFALRGGKLVPAGRSLLLPDLDLELLASMLDRDTLTQAVRDFRAALANA